VIQFWFVCVQTRFDVSGCRREVSDRDSAQSVDKTSHSLRGEEQTRRLDEEVSRQDEVARAMVTADVSLDSIILHEQHAVSAESSSRVALLTGNTATSPSVTR
jgi:hypothetical protein